MNGTAERHTTSIEGQAIAALSRGDPATAFLHMDRRCRILPPADIHAHVLRAEALHQLGELPSALSALEYALSLAPEDREANRRMFAWATRNQKLQAASRLVACEYTLDTLRAAMPVLASAKRPAIGTILIFDEFVTGWTAWNGAMPPTLHIFDGVIERSFPLFAQTTHVLYGCGFDKVANFAVRRQANSFSQTAALRLLGETYVSVRAGPNSRNDARLEAPAGTTAWVSPNSVPTKKTEKLTVIVPIYRDFEATRICLEGLRKEISESSDCHAILVDDCSPEPQIVSYVESFRNVPN